MTSDFFDEPEQQSRVKAEIVVNCFVAWSRIMTKRTQRVGYFDFYAGPGRYKSGEKSVPLLILEQAIASPKLRQRLVSMFSDANPEYTASLHAEIDSLSGIDQLRYKPRILTAEVDDDVAKYFEELRTIPALSFIDPWGYKGLSLRLIKAVVKDWGCEVIFFFNYNRINMGIDNSLVEQHMRALLGQKRLDDIRAEMAEMNPAEREACVCRALGKALEGMGAPHLIPFKFRRGDGRVSHYICHVSKHPLGYSIMKDVMASRGVVDEDGVPAFEYLPRGTGHQLLFGQPRPLLALAQDLMRRFAGQRLTTVEIYNLHNVGTPFVKRNYKKVLLDMEERGEIRVESPGRRKPGTFSDRLVVSFP
jgi:three-Cys-motif partner protein